MYTQFRQREYLQLLNTSLLWFMLQGNRGASAMILVDGNSRQFPIPTSRTSTDSIHRSVLNAADGLIRVRISPWVLPALDYPWSFSACNADREAKYARGSGLKCPRTNLTQRRKKRRVCGQSLDKWTTRRFSNLILPIRPPLRRFWRRNSLAHVSRLLFTDGEPLVYTSTSREEKIFLRTSFPITFGCK